MQVAFTVHPYKDTGTYVLSSIDEIQMLLEDHILKTQTMKFSLYVKQIEAETLLVFCRMFVSLYVFVYPCLSP